MEAYTLVDKEAENTQENEIRVKVDGQVSKYLRYAFRVLNKQECTSLTIRAMGNAIVKALILIELVKRRIGNLHQLNKIYSEQKTDEYRPKYEGMESIFQTRLVTALDCELSKEQLDNTQVGYQTPEPQETRPVQQFKPRVKPPPTTQYTKSNTEKPDSGHKPDHTEKQQERPTRGGLARGRGTNTYRDTEVRQRGVGRGVMRGQPRTAQEGDRIYQNDDRPARGRGRGGFNETQRARGGRGSMRGGRGERPVPQRRYSDSNVNASTRGQSTRPEGDIVERPARGGHAANMERPSIESRITYAGRGRGNDYETRGGYEGGGRGSYEARGRGEFQHRGRGDRPVFEGRGRGGYEPKEFRGRGGYEGRGRGHDFGDRGRGERHYVNEDRQGYREHRNPRGGYGESRDQPRSYNEPPPVTIVKGGSRGRGANSRGGVDHASFQEDQSEPAQNDYQDRRNEVGREPNQNYGDAPHDYHRQNYSEFRPHQDYKPSDRDDFHVQPPRYQQNSNFGGEGDYQRGGFRGRGRGRGNQEEGSYRGRNNYDYNQQRPRYGQDDEPQVQARGRGYDRGGIRMRGGFQERGRGERGSFRGYRGGDQERGGYQARGTYRGDHRGDRDYPAEKGGPPSRGRGSSYIKPDGQADHYNSNQEGSYQQEQDQD